MIATSLADYETWKLERRCEKVFVSGAACRVAREEMAADTAHVQRLSRRLVEGVRAQLEHVVFNGDEGNTYAGCLNLSFAYVEVQSVSDVFITNVG